MLKHIRERTHGIIVWVVVSAIIVAFALFGLGSYFSGSVDDFVATINGEKVSARDFQLAYQRERAFRQSIMGENFDPAKLDEVEIKNSALDRLINAQVFSVSAEDAGFYVGREMLGNLIRSQKEFQSEGQFDRALYARLLSGQGWSTSVFENSMQKDMLAEQFLKGIRDTEFVTEDELNSLFKIEQQRRRFDYLLIKMSDFAEASQPNDDEIESYYNEHQDRYAVPEQVSVAYLELNVEDLKKGIEDPSEDDLKKRYEEVRLNFSIPEERKASHILFKLEEDSDESVRLKIKEKANEVLKRVKAGEAFDKLAKEFSDDPGSAENGGDLGFFGKGSMVKSFEEAAFSMIKGDVSDLVESPFGFHIIKLVDIQAEEIKPFAAVRNDLLENYKQDVALDRFFDIADQMTNLTYENPDSLEIAAQELKMEIKSSPLFNKNFGTGIAGEVKVRNAAFSDDVKVSGNNSELIELDSNKAIVLRVKESKPSSIKSLESVKTLIVQSLKFEKARHETVKKGEALLSKVEGGASLEKMVEEGKVAFKKSKLITRQDNSENAEIVREVFKLKKPAKGENSFSGIVLANGDYAVISLGEVESGDLAKVEAEKSKSLKQAVIIQRTRQLSSGLLDSLKARTDIVEFRNRL